MVQPVVSVRLPGHRAMPAIALIVCIMLLSLAVAGCGGAARTTGSVAAESAVTFTTADGVTLSGRVFGEGETGVVLAHMYPKDQSSWYEFGRVLAREGYQALAFDFRGYGTSTGTKQIGLIDRDIEAAVLALRNRGAKIVVVIGASMGGTAALMEAAREPPDGLVILSAPVEFRGLDAAAAATVTCPKLFVVAEADTVATDMQKLFQLANEPKEIVMLAGAPLHGSDMLKGEEGARAQELILDFIAGCAGQ